MAATFNPDLSDAISRIRQIIGDTTVARAQFQDETITAYLAAKGDNENAVAAQLAWDLSAKWASAVDVEVDQQKVTSASNLSKRYAELAKRLEDQGRAGAALTSSGFGGVYVGGLDDCRGPSLTFPYECDAGICG